MRALLDVNMLVALLDAGHLHHGIALDWLAGHQAEGWASSPATQNGCLRILSLPSYPNSQPLARVAERLSQAVADPSHEFWPDDISLLDPGRLSWRHLLGSRQVSDAYLLALAVHHDARLVTLDQGISRQTVAAAQKKHLLIVT